MRSRRRMSGQSLVEFAVVATLALTMMLGILDFAFSFAGKVAATNAVRLAARYAATNSSAWDSAARPAYASIQGHLILTAIPARIINDDTHVVITYLVPGTGTSGVACGHYQQANPPGFIANAGYTQATCVISGNLITIQATYVYSYMTPMLASTFTSTTISTQATEILEMP